MPIVATDLAALLEASGYGVLQADAQGRITHLNAAAQALLPAAAARAAEAGAQGPRLHWRALVGRHDSAMQRRDIQRALRQHARWSGELLLRGGDGSALPCEALLLAHHDAAGAIARYSALLRDRRAEHLAQRQIQRQADILEAITEAIPTTVVVVDGRGLYRFANQAFVRYAGRPREQIIGRSAIDVLGADEVARRKPFMGRALAGESVEFVLDYPGEQGTRWLSLACIPLKLDGVVDGFVGISQDVTREHRERARLTHLAERDPLTGLLNRAGFERAIERLMLGADADTVGLLYIDLDHFKPINDNQGHLSGDRVLQQFAQRLQRAVRTSDVVARLGGDEFVVVLAGVHETAQALLVADKALAAAREPVEVEGKVLRFSASIGVAVGIQPAAGWRELVARADALLYRAKAEGRDRAAA